MSTIAWTRSRGPSPLDSPCLVRRVNQLASEPGPRETPLACQSARRDSEDGGGLVDGQSGKVAEHDDFGQMGPFNLELLDCLVHGQEVVGGGR